MKKAYGAGCPFQMKAEETIRRMDESGRCGRSFLFAIDFEMDEGIFISEPLNQKEILFDVRGQGNAPTHTDTNESKVPVTFIPHPESLETYRHRFDRIRTALMRGDSFLANLTIATPIEMNISLEEVFSRSRASYKLLIPGRLVCFSPERFVKIENGQISTNPMKGTIDASLPDAAGRLLSDYKETAEHRTIVDLLRNDLNRVSHHVRVSRFRYLDELHTNKGRLLQMSSEITGTLPAEKEKRFGSIIQELLPAGSISGAPKEATIEAIREAEGQQRGFYTGVFGYFDGSSFDSAVMIRYIEQLPDGQYLFRSGGGITINSRCDDEYRETQQKVYLPF